MQSGLSFGNIFRFWLPLAGTWLMMAVEGPLLAALIARMAAAELNLAAYGVAYAFALVAEAPIIMLMSAATALVNGAESYRRLRSFTLILTLLVTVGMAVLLVPPLFDLLMIRVIGLTPEISSRVYLSLLVLLPWPGVIGWRRFYQGVLIRNRQTRRVAVATVGRVVTMSLAALLLFRSSDIQGALMGGIALSCGVAVEMLATRLLAGGAVRGMLDREDRGAVRSLRELGYYYLPLALTPFITLGIHPVVTFFLGKGKLPLESLAVMPVIGALTFVFRAVGLSFQEVAIALMGDNLRHWRPIGQFALLLACVLSGCLLLIAMTPLADLWLVRVSGLSPLLAEFSLLPLQLMALLPATTVMTAYLRALLMGGQATRPISTATALEALVIILVLTGLLIQGGLAGAVCAALAYLVGRTVAILWMLLPVRQILRARPIE
ncbi:MAG: hypothetical protein RQ754_01145 [Desulfuromonadales bacterium]|nr:hypothetical protein [Desulfuromonadales bacterium]